MIISKTLTGAWAVFLWDAHVGHGTEDVPDIAISDPRRLVNIWHFITGVVTMVTYLVTHWNATIFRTDKVIYATCLIGHNGTCRLCNVCTCRFNGTRISISTGFNASCTNHTGLYYCDIIAFQAGAMLSGEAWALCGSTLVKTCAVMVVWEEPEVVSVVLATNWLTGATFGLIRLAFVTIKVRSACITELGGRDTAYSITLVVPRTVQLVRCESQNRSRTVEAAGLTCW